MRCILRLFGLWLALGSALWWWAAGARVGWWQTRVGVERIDEFTGLSVLEWREGFVPGIETLLGGVLLGAGLAVGATFLFRKLPTNRKST